MPKQHNAKLRPSASPEQCVPEKPTEHTFAVAPSDALIAAIIENQRLDAALGVSAVQNDGAPDKVAQDAYDQSIRILEEWAAPAQTLEGALAALHFARRQASEWCNAEEVVSLVRSALGFLEAENPNCKGLAGPGAPQDLSEAISTFHQCEARFARVSARRKENGRKWNAANADLQRALRILEDWSSPAQTREEALAALHLALRQARIFCSALEVEAMLRAAIDFLENEGATRSIFSRHLSPADNPDRFVAALRSTLDGASKPACSPVVGSVMKVIAPGAEDDGEQVGRTERGYLPITGGNAPSASERTGLENQNSGPPPQTVDAALREFYNSMAKMALSAERAEYMAAMLNRRLDGLVPVDEDPKATSFTLDRFEAKVVMFAVNDVDVRIGDLAEQLREMEERFEEFCVSQGAFKRYGGDFT